MTSAASTDGHTYVDSVSSLPKVSVTQLAVKASLAVLPVPLGPQPLTLPVRAVLAPGPAPAGCRVTRASLSALPLSGKLVSPKWKNFKGLKLQWRDKIRLNNAIWRAWYMQYLEKRKNPVCHFVTPLDGSVDVDEHRRPEAITTEGKYWKSRIEIVIREYHKWRAYFKKRVWAWAPGARAGRGVREPLSGLPSCPALGASGGDSVLIQPQERPARP
ncbi:MLX-interacting protein [Galemys pyrenaicus]|uniref:MLX-interacting protein n=1 Tax=Galemys pyrenaicus TaxID=202257 RepID=A0A8J6DMJ1_GALPY|nr:MLX-interacting protein [Galemys pyrenaicus]